MKKNLQVWFCVNRNSEIRMFLDIEPKKNEKLGRYEGKNPYVNSVLIKDIEALVKASKITFDTQPQCIGIQIESNE